MIVTGGPGPHHVETVVAGLTAGPYVFSLRFKPIGDRVIEVAARSGTDGPKASTSCNPKMDSAIRSIDAFDGGMSDLGNDWMLCWVSLEVPDTSVGIEVSTLLQSGIASYAGDGHSGLVFDDIELHPGWRPATVETGPPGGENAMN